MDYGYLSDGMFARKEQSTRFSSWMLFLIGTFSLTQIRIGFAIGISEIFVYLAAPFIFMRDYYLLKRNGMMFLVGMGILVSIMCVVSGFYNHTPLLFIIKGLGSTYPLFAFPVVLHRLLYKNMNGLRWLLLGAALSAVINIFVFQASVERFRYGEGADEASVEAIMSGPIFWIGRLQGFVTLPTYGWYLQTPILYSVFAPLAFAFFSILTSASGRSAALGFLGGALIIGICRKRYASMRLFCKNFYLVMLIAAIGLFAAHRLYRVAAQGGYLGEKSRDKYEKQSQGSKSVLRLLMGGRGEFFIGLLAALDKPLMGHGPWAVDDGGYVSEFMRKYGTSEDYERTLQGEAYMRRVIGWERRGYIPAHSHIVSFWLWFGVVGLFYWGYVVYAIFRYLHHELTAVPQWVGFLAGGAPTMLWALFFSGFGFRISTLPYVIVLVMAHNVHKRRINLTPDMQQEIFKAENGR